MITVSQPIMRNILSSPSLSPAAVPVAVAVATPPLETNNEQVTEIVANKQTINNEMVESGMKVEEEIIVGAEETVIATEEIVDENMMEIVMQTIDLTGDDDDEELERRMDSLFGDNEPLFKDDTVSVVVICK